MTLTSTRTLFWAGDVFAPKLRIRTREGREMSAQQFLQSAFLDMWEVVARNLGDLDAVLGFEVGRFSRAARTDSLLTAATDHE